MDQQGRNVNEVAELRRSVARSNERVMERFRRVLEDDPSVDLSTILPNYYQSMRAEIQLEEQVTQRIMQTEGVANDDEPAKIVFELWPEAHEALQIIHDSSKNGEILAVALRSMLEKSEVIYRMGFRHYVTKCNNAALIVTCFHPDSCATGVDFTEYTGLQYLQIHMPNIPAPRPHGLIVSGREAYMLSTYISGETLEAVWPKLTQDQKSQVRDDLTVMIGRMREHTRLSRMPLGGVQGEGCKDTRRYVRYSSRPLQNAAEFWTFVYGKPNGPTPAYIEAVQSWIKSSQTEPCVFTHGDIRPANIHGIFNNGQCLINGLLDWETCGFYPESWEAGKITSLLIGRETWDWYSFLPKCVSPSLFPQQWLTNRFWDRYLYHESVPVDVD